MTSRQTWMITGANRGLGRALTLAALEAGHAVVATVRGAHSLPKHERLFVQQLDVRDRLGAFAAVAQAVARFGRLDVLVNNAGYGLIGAVEEATEEEARAILDTDLFGPLWLSQAAIPVMRDQGSGHIVQISTVGAVGTIPTLGLYNSAKWGLEGFSEAMAAEVGRFGIRVTLAEPGAIDTDWAGGSMRFSSPLAAYDGLRTELFGTATVPWPSAEAAGGTSPADVAAAILAHVGEDGDPRLRLLIGDDAPGQVEAALKLRHEDYKRDHRFRSR
ncbi:SDR family NAD(P)-dependent oxidoreductase [Paeniglutamicibacter kerguelensis]|uniref:NAD(P)-dependent dehydrogenase (Short-subunit alcohol dehydrogenase family) n=1 Tax=Paeniglutamicibacter kerguelensis TaxID=254788 RepID=A0ABS4XBY4_9MICC|nr:SDR family NAD(P)-dependent oxidoreductase [Paeniglutamicibacter kerguelensis]MBP2385861.1 NAD(P)-dependent dehydrogenase (short-subunit alcohol dehydrogenase family) [Paeniglutamicibacter kerguelensis]